MKLRIGYLMQNGAPDLSSLSGPQLHTVAVIKGLQNIGHEVRTVAVQKSKLGWSDDLLTWSGPQFGLTRTKLFRLTESALRRAQYELKLPFVGLFDSLHYADASTHILKGFDLFYERHGYMGFGGVIAARRMGVPIVIEINGNIIKEIDEIGIEMSPRQRNLGRWITYRTWLAANRIVAVSEVLKNQLMSVGIPEEKISVVMNGVNIELFSRIFDHDCIREKYQITASPIVTFVGSFQPWHGVELLMNSFGMLQSEFPNLQLILVGDGIGRNGIEAQIAQMGLEKNVKLLGNLPQDQVAAVLSITDVVVAPYPFHHQEIAGTPLKLLEYMAAGKAIVASTAPIHEVIIDGVTGLRVTPADVNALAKGISRLLSNEELRAILGSNARDQAKHYSWDRTINELNNIFMAEISRSRKYP